MVPSHYYFQGVHKFLDDFQFRNAVTDDLWAALESVSSQHPVLQVIFPYIRFCLTPVPPQVTRQGGGVYRVTQERYLTDQTAVDLSPPSPYGYQWEVPVTWVSSRTNITSTRWLARGEAMTGVTPLVKLPREGLVDNFSPIPAYSQVDRKKASETAEGKGRVEKRERGRGGEKAKIESFIDRRDPVLM